MTTSVRHLAPAFRTYAGERALGALGKELDRTGARQVVVVCGASIRAHDAFTLVEEAIGERLAGTFDTVSAHSPVPTVEAAAAMLVDTGADAVVAVGGGSAVVTARAAGILAAEEGDVRDLSTRRVDGRLVSPRLSAPKITQWVVPSTPTTAYAKAGAAVRDTESGERLALFDPKARAAGVFLHPALAATASTDLVRGAALNAFAMCVDGLQSGTDDPLAEAQLRHALSMFREWLPRTGGPDRVDGEVGTRLMLASLLAGQASDHVGTGLAQPISHALGPRSSVANGVIEAMVLPHTMRFNLGHTDTGLRAVGASLDPVRGTSAEASIKVVEDLLGDWGVPRRWDQVDVSQEDLAATLDHVADDWAATTVPRPAGRDELREILAHLL